MFGNANNLHLRYRLGLDSCYLLSRTGSRQHLGSLQGKRTGGRNRFFRLTTSPSRLIEAADLIYRLILEIGQ